MAKGNTAYNIPHHNDSEGLCMLNVSENQDLTLSAKASISTPKASYHTSPKVDNPISPKASKSKKKKEPSFWRRDFDLKLTKLILK